MGELRTYRQVGALEIWLNDSQIIMQKPDYSG